MRGTWGTNSHSASSAARTERRAGARKAVSGRRPAKQGEARAREVATRDRASVGLRGKHPHTHIKSQHEQGWAYSRTLKS